ncbi:MAG: hypothetical protein KDI19_06205 [Pseudomonadales bacterium]|nr:hypothetical protein [Pseudomonadales bacterium]
MLTLLACAATSSHASLPGCEADFTPAPSGYNFVKALRPEPDLPRGTVIGTIHYTRLPVFDETDPTENNVVFRWANRFHVISTERTIEREVLLRPGDRYDEHSLEESARILRSAGYLYDADIRPVRLCDGVADVEVITRDVWSFTPEVSFDRSGGENSSQFGIAETNLLGSGRTVSFASSNDVDRKSTSFGLEDRNIGGRRIAGKLSWIDSDDGYHQFARFQKPFFELNSRQAWLVSADRVARDDTQYFRGQKVSALQHEIDEYIASVGFSPGLTGNMTKRLRFGYTYREDRFGPASDLPAPAAVPDDRRLSYPFVELALIEDNYVRATNINQIHRTEDLHIGLSASLFLGAATIALGSDETRFVFRADASDTLLYTDTSLLQHEANLSGVYNRSRQHTENVVANYAIRYYRAQTTHRAFFAQVKTTWTDNLDASSQVVMGGQTGARAFDNRLQTGDRSLLLTLEERQYTDLHILGLVRVGFAAFIDAGRAWTPGVDDGLANDILADFGVGLRLASSKTNVGGIAHVDVAFPLTNRSEPGVSGVQVSITLQDTF